MVQLGGGDGLVREAALERPTPAHPGAGAPGGWSLDVRGWAVGGAAPVEHVEFALPGVSKGRTANSNVRVVTPPVVANGLLYVRDQELLYAYRVRAK